MLNIKQLYPILKQHEKLAEKRSPLFTQNKYGKLLGYFMIGLIIVYLLFFSVMLALIAQDTKSCTAYEFLYTMLPYIMIIDIGVRFMAQETPLHHVKPYALLPLSKYTCIDFFIIRSILAYSNLFWMFLYVPFAIMAVVFSSGIGVTLLFILGFYIIELLFSQFYLILRTLVNKNILWWLIIVPILLLCASPMFFKADWTLTFSWVRLFKGYQHLGYWICTGNIIAWLSLITLVAITTYANRCLQYKFVYAELSRKDKTIKVSTKRKLTFMDKWGAIGEFIHLEILSIRRNKNIRKACITSTCVVLVMSILCAFTETYDYMLKFWIVYNFTIFDTFLTMRILMYEGNYIERLMVDHFSIESLLRAKYYIYSCILILPFLLMLPLVFMGKATLLSLFAFLLFAAGFVNCIFMQMAVYNKQTMPLNQKFTGKVKTDNFWITMIITFCGFGLPLLIYKILLLFASETIASLMLIILGIAFIITHKLWIHNIYIRMMNRKYTKIEAMIATRNQ